MNRKWLTAVIALAFSITASSQTLFTFGDQAVDSKEFLRAYNKNNAPVTANKDKAIREYLNLYINSRLKIKEAYARGYDSLPQILAEVANLRGQIIENYLSDPEAIDRLAKEAFDRSKKDVHVAHLFISYKNSSGIIDTVAATKKLEEVTKKLSSGKDFTSLVKEYSDEPGAKETGGDMGFITVFTLPYEFENVIYSTSPGKTSKLHRSKIGYHIFKNIEERKAVGKIKAAQILIAFPPGADDVQKKHLANLADSLYKRLVAGDDFAKLASQFSNDYIGAQNGGNVPDIAVGQFDPAFEKVVWSLSKDGAISKPHLSTHGYHIIKRISAKPVVTDPKNQENMDELKLRIKGDDRWRTAKDFIYEKVKKEAGLKWEPFNKDAVWAFSDSLLNFKPGGLGNTIKMTTPLFTIGDTTIRAMHWIAYAQAFRMKADRSGHKPWPELMDEFSKTAMFEYYRANLEKFNPEFAAQMAEFRDGNLFFEIMQTEIWNKAQSDTLALKALFEKNKSNYDWKPSADAIIFFSADASTAKTVREQLKKKPEDWRRIAETYGEKMITDSSRYEWAQIPGLKGTPKAGMLTPDLSNPADNTVSYSYIVKVYGSASPRSFADAKGMVMNDYQNYLEEKWLDELKKKYPVVINQKELGKIVD
jgi:peptidyl-prolyl cis-trans isomerase SurA